MQIREGILRDGLRLIVWYPLRWVIKIIPIRWGIALLTLMGDVHATMSRGKKNRLKENLKLLRGPAVVRDEDAVVREYFRNHYVDHLLIFIFPKLGRREAEQFVEIEGLEHLNAAKDRGNGVILVHGHVGPVHLPLVVLSLLGYRMKQIGMPSDEGLSWIGKNVAFRLRMRYEAKMPAEIIMADGFLRPAFRWLKDNGIIMITGDGTGTEQRVGRHEAFPFCGQRVLFPLGPALLAEKTGAAILPMFIIPGERKPYRIVIEPPLDSLRRADEKARDITGQFIVRLEHRVSRFPGWMHFLDRFAAGQIIEAGVVAAAPSTGESRSGQVSGDNSKGRI